MTYPHVYACEVSATAAYAGVASCRCGATSATGLGRIRGETFSRGHDCPAAMRERIALLEDALAELHTARRDAFVAGREAEREDVIEYLRAEERSIRRAGADDVMDLLQIIDTIESGDHIEHGDEPDDTPSNAARCRADDANDEAAEDAAIAADTLTDTTNEDPDARD